MGKITEGSGLAWKLNKWIKIHYVKNCYKRIRRATDPSARLKARLQGVAPTM
jgi:hypothetical protein